MESRREHFKGQQDRSLQAVKITGAVSVQAGGSACVLSCISPELFDLKGKKKRRQVSVSMLFHRVARTLILGSSGILPLGTAAFMLGDESKNESTTMSNSGTKAQQSVYPSCIPLFYKSGVNNANSNYLLNILRAR